MHHTVIPIPHGSLQDVGVGTAPGGNARHPPVRIVWMPEDPVDLGVQPLARIHDRVCILLEGHLAFAVTRHSHRISQVALARDTSQPTGDALIRSRGGAVAIESVDLLLEEDLGPIAVIVPFHLVGVVHVDALRVILMGALVVIAGFRMRHQADRSTHRS